MVDHIADEVDQMILGQPFTQARRQQKVLFRKVRTVALAHDTLCTTAVPVPPAQSLLSTVGLSQTHLTSPTDYFSDTLLVPPAHLVIKLLSHCCFAGLSRVLVSRRGIVALFETGAAASVAALDERRREIAAAAVAANQFLWG